MGSARNNQTERWLNPAGDRLLILNDAVVFCIEVGMDESQAGSDATKSNPESITAMSSETCGPLGAGAKWDPHSP